LSYHAEISAVHKHLLVERPVNFSEKGRSDVFAEHHHILAVVIFGPGEKSPRFDIVFECATCRDWRTLLWGAETQIKT
jgi:hypothetical protein